MNRSMAGRTGIEITALPDEITGWGNRGAHGAVMIRWEREKVEGYNWD